MASKQPSSMDPNAVFERDVKFYKPRGDVILAARVPFQAKASGPPTYKIFKVHKFLLGLRSQVFHNLFADSDASAPNDFLEGLPLVELHGDNPEEFAVLLSYIYEPERSFPVFSTLRPNISITITGAVRLSDKYLLEPLRKQLVAYVVAEWPTTLREWDIQQAEINAIKQTIFSVTTVDGNEIDPGQLLSDRLPEPVSAIVFAREFGCTKILPAAFYRLLQISFKADWTLRESWSASDIDAAHEDDDEYAHIPLARWSLLDKADLTLYMRGLHEAEDYEAPFSKFVSCDCRPDEHDFAYDGWEEDRQWACYVFVEKMVRMLGKARGGTAARDPLGWLKDCMEYERFPALAKKRPNELCQQCEVVLREAVAMERQRIWQELVPKWFQLE